MSVVYINGIPVANTGFGYIDSYYSPQRHFRDMADAQDVEYEEVYEQENEQENEQAGAMVE